MRRRAILDHGGCARIFTLEGRCVGHGDPPTSNPLVSNFILSKICT